MENRNQKLEQIRQESIKAWHEARLNEAKEIGISKNAQGLGITGLGAGGSSVNNSYTDPVDFIWVLYVEDDDDYWYTQFNLETKTWTDSISFGVDSNIYLDYAYRTNGYGTGFAFENDDDGNDTYLCYVDSKGKLAWNSGPVEWDNYDVDGDNTIGLVEFFTVLNGAFEIKTFYRDIENTFTFDNYQGNTSFNLPNEVYGTKILYLFGNVSDNNLALYALDLLDGTKTLLYEPEPGNWIEYNTYSYQDTTYQNISNNLPKMIVLSGDDSNGDLKEIKVIDHDGNVFHDIASQFLQQGFDVSDINYFSASSNIFGKYEQTVSSDDTFMSIKTDNGVTETVIYFGCKDGALYYNAALPYPTYYFSVFNGNNLVLITPPEGGAADRGNMIVGLDDGLLDIVTVRPDGGTRSIALPSITAAMAMDGDDIVAFTVGEGQLVLFTWDVETGDTVFEPVAPGEQYSSPDDIFYVNNYYTLGNLETFMSADSDDSGDWTLVYRNSLTGSPFELLQSGDPINIYGSTGAPTLVYTDNNTYRVNQQTNDLTLIMSNANVITNGGSVGSTWKTNSPGWVITDTAETVEPVVYFVSTSDIIVIEPGEQVSYAAWTVNGINIQLQNGDVKFYTSGGEIKSEITGIPEFTAYSDIIFWEDGSQAYVFADETYVASLGNIQRLSPNDYWWD